MIRNFKTNVVCYGITMTGQIYGLSVCAQRILPIKFGIYNRMVYSAMPSRHSTFECVGRRFSARSLSALGRLVRFSNYSQSYFFCHCRRCSLHHPFRRTLWRFINRYWFSRRVLQSHVVVVKIAFMKWNSEEKVFYSIWPGKIQFFTCAMQWCSH